MFHAGQQIGIYTLINRIGRGGFGEVWLAERRTKFATTQVAVKLPLDEQVEHGTIEQEARLWAQASGHPNILPIIEAEDYDGQVVIVSEYAPDGSLENLLKGESSLTESLKASGELITVWNGKNSKGEEVEKCRLSVEKAVEVTTGILKGLEFLHARKIIHRDLKPGNILLQGDTPRLADFGLSRVLKTTSHATTAAGTPYYMAPEAFKRKRNAQTDVWSVGVILYQMLKGELPFSGDNIADLFGEIVMSEPAPLPDSIPLPLQEIVWKALAKDVDRRYQTAREMREELNKANRLSPTTVLPPKPKAVDDFDKILAEHSTIIVPEALPIVESPQSWTAKEEEEQALYEEEKPDLSTSDARPRIELPEAEEKRAKPALLPKHRVYLTLGLLLPLLLAVGLSAFSLSRDQSIKTLPGHTNVVKSIAFSPDGKLLVSGGYDTIVRLWDVASGRELKTLARHSSAVESVAFSPDGRMMASADDNHRGSAYQADCCTIKLWDVVSGLELKTLKKDSKGVASIAFSPDGSILASGGLDNTIRLWDVANGRELRALVGSSDWLRSVAFSPDGTMLASGSSDRTVRLWDVASGRELKMLAGHSHMVESVAFSPDGKQLASGSYDKTIKLWDVARGRELKTLAGHSSGVESVAFSPDGKILASGGYDKTIKLWDVASGRQLNTLAGHSGNVESVAFSPDGKTLASGSGDTWMKLWQVESVRAGTLTVLLIVVSACLLTIIIHISGMAVAGLLVGAPFEEVSFFTGGRVFGIRLGGIMFNIRAIPLGGFVKFDEQEFANIHPARKLFIACSGELSLLILAIMVFGVSDGLLRFIYGFYQIVAGALSPNARGAQYLFALFESARVNPFWTTAGLFAVIFAVFNLLPVPTLNGGAMILILLEWVMAKTFNVRLPLNVKERIQQIGFILMLMIFICWILAFFFFLRKVLF